MVLGFLFASSDEPMPEKKTPGKATLKRRSSAAPVALPPSDGVDAPAVTLGIDAKSSEDVPDESKSAPPVDAIGAAPDGNDTQTKLSDEVKAAMEPCELGASPEADEVVADVGGESDGEAVGESAANAPVEASMDAVENGSGAEGVDAVDGSAAASTEVTDADEIKGDPEVTAAEPISADAAEPVSAEVVDATEKIDAEVAGTNQAERAAETEIQVNVKLLPETVDCDTCGGADTQLTNADAESGFDDDTDDSDDEAQHVSAQVDEQPPTDMSAQLAELRAAVDAVSSKYEMLAQDVVTSASNAAATAAAVSASAAVSTATAAAHAHSAPVTEAVFARFDALHEAVQSAPQPTDALDKAFASINDKLDAVIASHDALSKSVRLLQDAAATPKAVKLVDGAEDQFKKSAKARLRQSSEALCRARPPACAPASPTDSKPPGSRQSMRPWTLHAKPRHAPTTP